jgi:xanthine dehydrogenase molybdenum-binding subunit
MKNLTGVGTLYRGTPITSCGLAECILRGSEWIGWKEKWPRKGGRTGSKSRGVGMACSQWVSGSQPTKLDATTSILKVNEDGTVNLLMGCTDAGTGSKTTLSQIAAQELGIKFEDIYITYGDTNVTPFDVGSHASRTCYVAGGAVQRAAADVKEQILKEAAQFLGSNVTDLFIKDRLIYVKGNPERNIPIGEVARAAYYHGKQFIGKVSYSPQVSPPSFGAQFAEVGVDQETGKVEIVSFVATYDCGRAINPEIVRGQITGGIQQGIGFALIEEFCLDESGRPLNPNFTDYKVFTALDMPKIEVILVETNEPSGPFGAKSVGESAMVPTAPAIANAIRHATGVRMKELPITSERLLKALSDEAKSM